MRPRDVLIDRERRLSSIIMRHSASPSVRSSRREPSSALPEVQVWSRPTLREFVAQVEQEFGKGVDLSALFHTGLGRNERLSPADVKALCGQLGLPPDDFGV